MYQANCFLNGYYSFTDNVLEVARGALRERTDEYKHALIAAKVTRRHFLSATNSLVATESTLQKVST
jgi:hypothetical protein